MAGVVLTFMFLFSVMLSLMSDAGVQEIFIGVCTYCAVLVTLTPELWCRKGGLNWSNFICCGLLSGKTMLGILIVVG